MPIRQPIIVVLGHVDHGKTTLLDYIRGTTIAQKEPGLITQHVGATEVPLKVIKKLCDPILKAFRFELKIPGLLFIDTPGHEAFTSLRRRGGSIADLAVLVIDVNEGVKAQTIEAIEILRQFKVPFLIAANKIDLIPGWRTKEGSFLENLKEQSDVAKQELDNRIYNIVLALSNFGFNAERFDRVEDFTKYIAIVPICAISGEGIPELLALLAGLSQRYLEENLQIEVSGPARGTILEVKEEKGLGKTLDAIIYDGTLHVGDTIVIASPREPIVTKVRALLKPLPLRELREKGKFQQVKEVHAAAGVKICAPNVENVIAGMPFVATDDVEAAKKEMQEVVSQAIVDTDAVGVIIKADTLGSLEALVGMLRRHNIPVRKASIGDVSKEDLIQARHVKEVDELLGVVLAFNVKVTDDVRKLASDYDVKIFESNIIYKLLEDYEMWCWEKREEKRKKELETIVRPAKLQILPGYVFRQSKPAIVGIEVLAGVIKPGYELMRKDGKNIGKIKEIQSETQNISEAKRGQRVAISLPDVTVGRQIKEGDILYTNVRESDYKKIKEYLHEYLSPDELEVLNEIVEIRRKKKPLWGI